MALTVTLALNDIATIFDPADKSSVPDIVIEYVRRKGSQISLSIECPRALKVWRGPRPEKANPTPVEAISGEGRD